MSRSCGQFSSVVQRLTLPENTDLSDLIEKACESAYNARESYANDREIDALYLVDAINCIEIIASSIEGSDSAAFLSERAREDLDEALDLRRFKPTEARFYVDRAFDHLKALRRLIAEPAISV